MSEPESSITCSNPTCRHKVLVPPAVAAAIVGGRVESIRLFCQEHGFKLIIDGGEPRLFCERCAF